MVENEEQLLHSFFEENKPDIPDKGFSKRVIKALPTWEMRLHYGWSILLVAVFVGFFVHWDILQWVWDILAMVYAFVQNLIQTPGSLVTSFLTLVALLFSSLTFYVVKWYNDM